MGKGWARVTINKSLAARFLIGGQARATAPPIRSLDKRPQAKTPSHRGNLG